jgi:hypothetical protein
MPGYRDSPLMLTSMDSIGYSLPAIAAAPPLGKLKPAHVQERAL